MDVMRVETNRHWKTDVTPEVVVVATIHGDSVDAGVLKARGLWLPLTSS